jgi:hypothetical protein
MYFIYVLVLCLGEGDIHRFMRREGQEKNFTVKIGISENEGG